MTTPVDPDQLPEHDVIAILLRQHRRLSELFADVRAADVSRTSAGESVVAARNAEERHVKEALAELEMLEAMGRALLAAEKSAPAHPHPATHGGGWR